MGPWSETCLRRVETGLAWRRARRAQLPASGLEVHHHHSQADSRSAARLDTSSEWLRLFLELLDIVVAGAARLNSC